MALNNKVKTLEIRIGNRRAESNPESEEDLEELESDVKKMAEKILEYRATIPDQLKTTLDSILSTQRPNFSRIDDGSEPGPSAEHNAGRSLNFLGFVNLGFDKSFLIIDQDFVFIDSEEMEVDEERRTEEKIRLLKEKISSNISAMPIVVKMMKECISRIEKLDSCNGIIHPAFKKEKIG